MTEKSNTFSLVRRSIEMLFVSGAALVAVLYLVIFHILNVALPGPQVWKESNTQTSLSDFQK